ncbi:PqqD family protein [Sphingomonas sp. KRR8]|uniref:PqqD family protein n=1 Tax=Sphingomonas sp. KRR8 TaxID=2942996 RepID=UPI00202065C4|nr:PqqD family protein [Sphingomonas sp. KRR8]URD61686.1 PqqD family protein [Sphingomonas sp. KRR8]
MSADNPTYLRDRELLEAELGDELVALDVDEGLCFGFNDVATAIWRLLREPRTLAGLVEQLTDDYEVAPDECRSDTLAALEILQKHRLVRAI